MSGKCGSWHQIVILLIAIFLLTVTASAQTTLIVNKTSPACTVGNSYYSTIQAAVDAAASGSTILVCPGTYNESVSIGKPINMQSFEGTSNTIIVTPNPNCPAFFVTANKVNISGFTITGASGNLFGYPCSPNAISLSGADDVIISNNKITNSNVGISMGGLAERNIIKNNTIFYSVVGISMAQAKGNYITNNVVSGPYRGITFTGNQNDNNLISKNNIEYNWQGIWVAGFFSNLTITQNNFYGNTYHLYNGINEYQGSGKFDIVAKNNYWGTVNRSEISAKIWDYYDNPNEGTIYYEPFLTAPYPWKDRANFSISSYTPRVNTTTTLPINFSTTIPVGSAQLYLLYNPSVINATNVTAGSASAGALFSSKINNTEGKITLVLISVDGISNVGSLADIEFKVVGSVNNTTPLELVSEGVTDTKNIELNTILQNGNLIVISYPVGDVTGDNEITVADALMYLRFAVGEEVENANPLHDVTCDGKITAADALLVLRKAVGQEVSLEC